MSQTKLNIIPLPAFNDNYIWALVCSKRQEAIIVDPGDAKPVIRFLESAKLVLKGILVTHHHPDHTAGIKKLRELYHCEVYGSCDSRYQGITKALTHDDKLSLMDAEFRVIAVPGHTLDHIAFFSDSSDALEYPALFCGDTLFSGGCGRLFEGTAEQMHASLERLKKLPANTRIYCAHEYTLSNLAFAQAVEPDNQALQDYIEHCKELRSGVKPTLPSSLSIELTINPFLRTDRPEVRQYAAARASLHSDADEHSIFAALRSAKDKF